MNVNDLYILQLHFTFHKLCLVMAKYLGPKLITLSYAKFNSCNYFLCRLSLAHLVNFLSILYVPHCYILYAGHREIFNYEVTNVSVSPQPLNMNAKQDFGVQFDDLTPMEGKQCR